ncbi:MAG: EAL domain-containing protein [Planctomycetes bacterium]|nr:EAL domain-containing protein [Planctomycetota bacterium]
MSDPHPAPIAPRLLVSNPDPGLALHVSEALSALGFHATVVSSAEAVQTIQGLANSLVVTDTEAFLRELHERLTTVRDVTEDDAPTTEEPAFLARAARILAAAQPPNDHVALLVVHHDVPGLAEAEAHAVSTELARRLRACVRDRDAIGQTFQGEAPSLARLGAEDVIVLLPSLPRAHAAYKIARRLHDRLVEPIPTASGEVVARCSIGIAVHPGDGPEPAQLLERARAAQRSNGNAGTPDVRFHSAAMNAAAERRQLVENALQHAIERRELSVHYQPKVQIATNRIVGAEALVRWTHPELGFVSPGQFIPIAEEIGLISAIGEYVLESACRQNRAWQDAGLPPIRVAVNLSTVQLREERLMPTLRRVLAETKLDPQWLELEITESVLLNGVDAVLKRLEELKKLGIRLSIDDFGTGYSSLAYLKRFPIDTLKIDQAFVRDLTTDPYDAAITTSIVLMGKSLKLHVVAEGVETRGQLELLRVLECDEAQGYLFSKPIAPADFAALLARGIDPGLTKP